MHERIKETPELISSDSYRNGYFDEYMDLVLDYFKNDESANFGHWPDKEIGLKDSIPRNVGFYQAAEKWFELKHKVKVLRSERTNMRRFLASFIIVTGYPPHLGFKDIVHGIVWRSNWEDLKEHAQRELQYYIEEYKHSFNLLQRNLLKENSEAYESLVRLLSVLAELRLSVQHGNTPDEAIAQCARTNEQYSIDALKTIYTVYEDVLKIAGRKSRAGTRLSFFYKIDRLNSEYPALTLSSNITSSGTVSLDRDLPPMTNIRLSMNSSSIDVPDYSLILKNSDGKSVVQSKSHGMIKLPVIGLNETLKNIDVIITGLDECGFGVQHHLYDIKRQDKFLVFDQKTGMEIVSQEHEYKKGAKIIIVPLSKDVFDDLKICVDDQIAELKPLDHGLPACYIKSDDAFDMGDIHISFIDNPVSIQFEQQKRKESIFGTKRYFLRPITCSISNEDDVDVRITLLDKNKSEIRTITPTSDHFVLKNLAPALYHISLKTEESERSEKFWVLPFSDVTIDHQSVSVQIKSNWSFRLKTENSALSSCHKDDEYIISSNTYGEYSGRLFFSENNVLKYTTAFRFNFRKNIAVYISGKEIENGALLTSEEVSLDSQIIFTNNGSDSSIYRIRIDYSGSGYGYSDSQIFQIDSQVQSRLSLADIIQHIRKYSIKQTCFTVTNEVEELFSFSIYREDLPLQADSENRVYSEPKGLFDGYLVFDLLRLWKNPVHCFQDEYKPSKPGIYQIYGFQYNYSDSSSDLDRDRKYIRAYSNPVLINQNYTYTDISSSDELHNQLVRFYRAIEQGESVSTCHGFADLLSNKEYGAKIVKIFKNLRKFPFRCDFAVYSLLPQYHPILAAWWELARDKNNPEIHFIDDNSGNALLDSFFLDDHPCFSWELVTIDDLHSLSKNGLLPQDDLKSLGLFCVSYDSGDSIRTMSWLLMFWYRSFCKRNQSDKEFHEFIRFIPLLPNNPYTNWDRDERESLPTAGNGNERILDEFISDQLEKQSCIDKAAKKQLERMVELTRKGLIWKDFERYISVIPLYKHPHIQLYRTGNMLEGVPERSLWCSFISLYLVHRQLGIDESLECIIKLDSESLAVLVKWLKRHSLALFAKWYHYWMAIHWEED